MVSECQVVNEAEEGFCARVMLVGGVPLISLAVDADVDLCEIDACKLASLDSVVVTEKPSAPMFEVHNLVPCTQCVSDEEHDIDQFVLRRS